MPTSQWVYSGNECEHRDSDWFADIGFLHNFGNQLILLAFVQLSRPLISRAIDIVTEGWLPVWCHSDASGSDVPALFV